MKRLHLSCLLGTFVATGAYLAACSDPVVSVPDPDGSTTPVPTTSPTPSTTPTTPVDAGDGAAPKDATAVDTGVDATSDAADASSSDASSSDAAVDAADAADASDGSDGAVVPGPGTATTVADIPALTDFDFVGDHLVYKTGGASTVATHCTLPACDDPVGIGGLSDRWGVGDDMRVHALLSGSSWKTVAFDNTGPTTTPISYSTYSNFPYSYNAGRVEIGMLRLTPQPVGGGRFEFRTSNGSGGNTGRVGRVSGLIHSNAGAAAVYTPRQQQFLPPNPPTAARFGGVSAPVPASEPSLVAVSAAGPTVTYPTVVVVRGGVVEACPLATPCMAWKSLGAIGTTLNMDGTHLYVASATGLMRCALAEIGTTGTCTLVAHGPAEPAAAPLYLTATHAWYRSGTTVRRVLK